MCARFLCFVQHTHSNFLKFGLAGVYWLCGFGNRAIDLVLKSVGISVDAHGFGISVGLLISMFTYNLYLILDPGR